MDVSNKWRKVLAEEVGIKTIWTEPHTPQKNDADQEIKTITSNNLQRMRAANMSERLWHFLIIHESDIRSCTPRDKYHSLEGGLPREVIEQNTLDT